MWCKKYIFGILRLNDERVDEMRQIRREADELPRAVVDQSRRRSAVVDPLDVGHGTLVVDPLDVGSDVDRSAACLSWRSSRLRTRLDAVSQRLSLLT